MAHSSLWRRWRATDPDVFGGATKGTGKTDGKAPLRETTEPRYMSKEDVIVARAKLCRVADVDHTKRLHGNFAPFQLAMRATAYA
jgi:hypothetical protein